MFDIVLYGDDVLRKKTEDIEEITPEIKKFIEEMYETMYANDGVGLAAPQVGKSLNVAIIDTSLGNNPEEKLTLINPEIIEKEGEQLEEEGCLSFPMLSARVTRPARVKVRYTDIEGNHKEIEGTELLARALVHEIDHLNGVVFIDHLKGLEKNMTLKRLKKLMDSEDWKRAS